ncbi:phytanoyl-CoA dioxygenase family protein (plasmid) [Streptomyces scopuliridis]|uniref:phytanoyl-CoA dioxygenase family protein n=1 Tax=Streptomyces scopuliridis TaxID=452529 RepID=UPI002DDB8DC7|nr:phytanoyl-CoA dioxygenase family protein [Streptomyces scopuliridis]WSB39076.1 phytanoyl-CoA dioxygenase family protein [Streptomyces scopuliridis]
MTTANRTDDPDQLMNAWRRDGFVHVPSILPPDTVKRMRSAVDELAERKRREVTEGPLSDQGEASVRIKNVIAATDAFDELVFHPRVMPVLERFLGTDFRLLSSEAFTRHPSEDFLLGFHTDGGPLLQRVIPGPQSNAIQAKVQFFLTHADQPGQGRLIMVCGSHQQVPKEALPNCYVAEANDQVAEGRLPDSAVEIPARAGDITVHTHSTWHAVGPNLQGGIRRSVILRYGQSWCVPHDHVTLGPEVLDRFPRERQRMLGYLGDSADPAASYKPAL